MSEISDFLQNVPMFSTLNKRQLEKLAKRVRERTFSAGETIIEQGANGIGMYLIVSGQVDVIRTLVGGETRKIDEQGPQDFIGELSLIDDAPRTASVVATEDVTVYVLHKLDFLDELEDEPQMAIAVLKEITARFRRIVTSL